MLKCSIEFTPSLLVHEKFLKPFYRNIERSSDEDVDRMEGVNEENEDRLTIHDMTGQDVGHYPETRSYLVEDSNGYASDEEDNDELNNSNYSPNVEMNTSEQSISESDSDSVSHPHRYKHEHEREKDIPRHHVKRTMKEDQYFEDSSRHKKRSKTEKASNTNTSSVKWDWKQNKFV